MSGVAFCASARASPRSLLGFSFFLSNIDVCKLPSCFDSLAPLLPLLSPRFPAHVPTHTLAARIMQHQCGDEATTNHQKVLRDRVCGSPVSYGFHGLTLGPRKDGQNESKPAKEEAFELKSVEVKAGECARAKSGCKATLAETVIVID